MASTVKMIVPKQLNTTAMNKVLRDEMKAYSPYLLKSFEHTTEGFKKVKPKFTSKLYILPHSLSIKVELGGDEESVKIWNYLDQGTKPHIIRPKHAKALAFKWGGPGSYKAGSSKGNLYSGKGSMSADAKPVAFKHVHHPGTEAREWRETIHDLHKVTFVRWMTSAFNKAAIASDHAIMTSSQGLGKK